MANVKIVLRSISPSDVGFFSGFCCIITSIIFICFGFIATTKIGSEILLFFVIPFLSFVGGYVYGFIIAWLYNFYARAWGGISIEVEQTFE